METFSQTFITPNTQGENENRILTSEKRNKLDAQVETLKGSTINDSGYYESESVNANDGKGDPESNPKVATHASDSVKRKVTGTSNRYFNWTLPITIVR